MTDLTLAHELGEAMQVAIGIRDGECLSITPYLPPAEPHHYRSGE